MSLPAHIMRSRLFSYKKQALLIDLSIPFLFYFLMSANFDMTSCADDFTSIDLEGDDLELLILPCNGREILMLNVRFWFAFSLARALMIALPFHATPGMLLSGVRLRKENGQSPHILDAISHVIWDTLPVHMAHFLFYFGFIEYKTIPLSNAGILIITAELLLDWPYYLNWKKLDTAETATRLESFFSEKTEKKFIRRWEKRWKIRRWLEKYNLFMIGKAFHGLGLLLFLFLSVNGNRVHRQVLKKESTVEGKLSGTTMLF